MSNFNRMCANCAELGKTCKGTTCKTWTGCVYYKEDKSKRIFNHYKTRLIGTSNRSNPGFIRYNCIEYMCSFPGIDPVEMAASLQNDGYTVLFDDSSITAKQNKAKRHQVEAYAASHKEALP